MEIEWSSMSKATFSYVYLQFGSRLTAISLPVLPTIGVCSVADVQQKFVATSVAQMLMPTSVVGLGTHG